MQLRPNVSGQVCSDVKDGQERHGRANSDSETAEATLSEAVTHRKSCSSALRLGLGAEVGTAAEVSRQGREEKALVTQEAQLGRSSGGVISSEWGKQPAGIISK